MASNAYRPALGPESEEAVAVLKPALSEAGMMGTGRHGKVTDADVVRYCIGMITYQVGILLSEKGITTVEDIQAQLVLRISGEANEQPTPG